MPFSIPQAASILRVPWLDAPAAFSNEDAPHILGMYRYDFTGAEPEPEPEPEEPVVPAAGGPGGGRRRGGSAVGVKDRRRIAKMVDDAWQQLYGPKEVPPSVAEAVIAEVAEDVAPMLSGQFGAYPALLRIQQALLALQAAIAAEAEDEAAVLAALSIV